MVPTYRTVLPSLAVTFFQRWAQITLYQKRKAIKRNDIFTSKSAAQNAQFFFFYF